MESFPYADGEDIEESALDHVDRGADKCEDPAEYERSVNIGQQGERLIPKGDRDENEDLDNGGANCYFLQMMHLFFILL